MQSDIAHVLFYLLSYLLESNMDGTRYPFVWTINHVNSKSFSSVGKYPLSFHPYPTAKHHKVTSYLWNLKFED